MSSPEYQQRRREYSKRWAAQVRLKALVILGGRCVKCGCEDTRILEIDHIYGDGHVDHKRGYTTARKVVSGETDITRLQLLCPNCHTLKTKGYI